MLLACFGVQKGLSPRYSLSSLFSIRHVQPTSILLCLWPKVVPRSLSDAGHSRMSHNTLLSIFTTNETAFFPFPISLSLSRARALPILSQLLPNTTPRPSRSVATTTTTTILPSSRATPINLLLQNNTINARLHKGKHQTGLALQLP